MFKMIKSPSQYYKYRLKAAIHISEQKYDKPNHFFKSRICQWNNNYSKQYPLVLVIWWIETREIKENQVFYCCKHRLQTQEKPGFRPAFPLPITELKLWIGKEGLHQRHTNTPSTFVAQSSLAFSLINFGIKTSVSTCLRWISSKGKKQIQKQTIRYSTDINWKVKRFQTFVLLDFILNTWTKHVVVKFLVN